MFLVIDPSVYNQTRLSLGLNNNWVHADFLNGRGLLFDIDEFLKNQKISLKDLRGLAVLVGKGSFTATRVATTVANTLAYTLVVPVLAALEIDFAKLPAEIMNTPVGRYASARYSAPANIGGKKL